jgi:hypothetical protein
MKAAEPWSLTSLKAAGRKTSRSRADSTPLAGQKHPNRFRPLAIWVFSSLSIAPLAGAALSSMKGLWGRKVRTTMGEVRLDEDK